MASRASCHSQWNLAEKRAERRDTDVHMRFSMLGLFLDGSRGRLCCPPAHFFRLVPAEPRFWQASTTRSAMAFSAALP